MFTLDQYLGALQGTIHILNGMVADMTIEQLHWNPPGSAHSVAATIAHAPLCTDWQMHVLFGKGGEPMFASSWAGKLGISEPIPQQPFQTLEWAQTVRIKPTQLAAYSQAVYGELEEWIRKMSEEELAKPIDMSLLGVGAQPLIWCLYNVVLNHLNQLMGEVAAVKGMQGLTGYPY